MLQHDKDALLCDLAETYHIFDIKALPLDKVALFSYGLSEDSRIKRSMNGNKAKLDTLLLASISDALRTLVYFQTEDAQHGRNRPESIVARLTGKEESHDSNVRTFKTIEDFEKAYKEAFEKGE